MIIKIGNFLFHYRNGLFPLVYALLLLKSAPVLPGYRGAALLGFLVGMTGQIVRAVTIGLEYIVRGGRNRQVYAEKLVQGGVFAHSRNPLYIGNFLIVLGVGIASNSTLFLSLAIPFFAFAYWAIIAAEENYLRGKFRRDFDDYCARVNRLLPNFSGLGQTLSGMRFNWRRLISAEYGSTFIWLSAILLVTLKNVWVNGDYYSAHLLALNLWISLGAVLLAYATARYLKKRGLLRGDRKKEPVPASLPDF